MTWKTGGLLALCIVPIAGGLARLHALGTGASVTAENARFVAMPLPIVVHIVAATLFAVLGALQFSPRLRRFTWHRRAGWVAFVSGGIVGISGLWMTLVYPWPVPDGVAVYLGRLVFGTAMLAALGCAIVSAARRDFTQHGRWMTRGYAIGMGAGTQVFTHLPFMLFLGPPGETGRAIAMLAGWVINVAAAEWIIRRGSAPHQRSGGRDQRVLGAAGEVREQHVHARIALE